MKIRGSLSHQLKTNIHLRKREVTLWLKKKRGSLKRQEDSKKITVQSFCFFQETKKKQVDEE